MNICSYLISVLWKYQPGIRIDKCIFSSQLSVVGQTSKSE